MHWDRLFHDLEDQLSAQIHAENESLVAERERLRVSRLAVHDRLRSLAGENEEIGLTFVDGLTVTASVQRAGPDWVALHRPPHDALCLVPLDAIASLALSAKALATSIDRPADLSALRARETFGFVVRGLVRRRTPVRVRLRTGNDLSGTIDRAGADHLDIALHDPGVPRRDRDVHGYRLLPFAAISEILAFPA